MIKLELNYHEQSLNCICINHCRIGIRYLPCARLVIEIEKLFKSENDFTDWYVLLESQEMIKSYCKLSVAPQLLHVT